MGDGLMALFGAPDPGSDHPRRAVAAALDIVREAGSITHPCLGEPLRVGCGVNSDDMMVGNIGSERRLDYTAMGDAVNVASRLCDEAVGGQVLVSEATLARLGYAQAHDLGFVRLRKRQEPVHAYSVTALA
jgi:adenylate cyclase